MNLPGSQIPSETPIPSKKVSPVFRWILPSTTDVVFLVLTLAMLFGRSSQYFFLDGDPGWHIRAGQYMVETRSIPHHDIFSFSMPNAWWVAYEWGSEIIFYELDHFFGLNGIVLFIVLILAGTYALLYKFLRRDGASFSLAFPFLIFIFVGSSFHWSARPHILSYLLAIIFFRVLDRFTQDRFPPKRLWVLPAIMVLWVNLHPGFIAGIILVFTFLAGVAGRWVFAAPEARTLLREKAARLAFAATATVVASLINPNGFSLYLYLWRYFGFVHRLNLINELSSPFFQMPIFLPFLLTIVALILLIQLSRYRLRLEESLTLMAWIALGLVSLRNIPVMFLICSPILVRLLRGLVEPLQEWSSRRPRAPAAFRRVFSRIESAAAMERHFKRHVLAFVMVFTLVLVLSHQGYWGARRVMQFGFLPRDFPLGALPMLKANMPRGNVFNEWGMGGFLIYYFYPHLKVFVDGRLDMYGENFTRQYLQLINSPETGPGESNWKRIFQRYRIQWVMIRREFALRHVLETDPAWTKIYEDGLCVIFVRK